MHSREFSLKNKTMFKILFLSLVLSSCGLIERFKTPEQPTDGTAETSATSEVATTPSADATDDLFSKTMDETSEHHTDNPSSISSTNTDPDLKSLEDEFSSDRPGETVKETQIALTPDKSHEAPLQVEEALPEIKSEPEAPAYSEAGQIKTYKVKKGETLMQIAFKLYGDISKWKDIKNMNAGIGNNTALRSNMELKYRAPETPFVWNPAGTPYLIKNGETLGTISNTVYSTPKKWKSIWENNKPLIKNPNVIYAGFTLYYTNGGMANYVQPKAAQPKMEESPVEEVMASEVVVATPAPSAPKAQSTVKFTESDEEQVDEAIQSLSAPKREESIKKAVETAVNAPKEAEIDLINNISVPHEQDEIAPDIDEEIQTL